MFKRAEGILLFEGKKLLFLSYLCQPKELPLTFQIYKLCPTVLRKILLEK